MFSRRIVAMNLMYWLFLAIAPAPEAPTVPTAVEVAAKSPDSTLYYDAEDFMKRTDIICYISSATTKRCKIHFNTNNNNFYRCVRVQRKVNNVSRDVAQCVRVNSEDINYLGE